MKKSKKVWIEDKPSIIETDTIIEKWAIFTPFQLQSQGLRGNIICLATFWMEAQSGESTHYKEGSFYKVLRIQSYSVTKQSFIMLPNVIRS